MAGLLSILNNAGQSLQAQSVALAVTSSNIANVNNPNYTREQVRFSSVGVNDLNGVVQAQGLEGTSVQQMLDPLLNQQVLREASLTSSDQSLQTWLQQAQTYLGQSISNSSASSSSTAAGDGGISAAVDKLMNAFQALAANPNDPGTKASVVQDAANLGSVLNSADQGLSQVQADATNQIGTDVTNANTYLATVANLNTQIAVAESGHPGAAVALRDQRTAALNKLAAIIPVQVTEQADGQDLVTTPGTGSSSVTLVQGQTVEGSLAYTGGSVTGGSPASTLALGSGSIQGALNASTGPIQTLRDNLDSLAKQLVTSVNAAYNPTNAAAGNFFDPAGTTAGTIAVASSLNATTLTAGTGAAGDNSIALAVAALANKPFATAGGDSIDGTFASFYAGAVGDFGQAVSTAGSNLQAQQSVQAMVQSQQSAVSGVNIDQEMTNLMQYQQAYQAGSETFQILNQLLGSVISQLGNSPG